MSPSRVSVEDFSQIEVLAADAGIDIQLVLEMVAFCLWEAIRKRVSPAPEAWLALKAKPDRIALFSKHLAEQTGRTWKYADVEKMWGDILVHAESHTRHPILFEDLLALLLNREQVCVFCARRPPEIRLVIDHSMPASRGGRSEYKNLQFACVECNLKKSDKIRKAYRNA